MRVKRSNGSVRRSARGPDWFFHWGRGVIGGIHPNSGSPRGISLRVTIVLVLFLAMIVVALIAWSVVRSVAATPPAWWRSVDARDPETIALAEEIQNSLITELHRIDRAPGEEWAIVLTPAQANAWLNAEFPSWLASSQGAQWPTEVVTLQVGFDPGRVRVAAELMMDGDRHYVSGSFRPRLDERGALWAEDAEFAIGRLGIPVREALDRMRSEIKGEWTSTLSRLSASASGDAALIDEPVINLSDGRRVRVVALESLADDLVVRLRTESK